MERPTLIYDHETFRIAQLMELRNTLGYDDDHSLDLSIVKCDTYIKTYGNSLSYTGIHRQFMAFYLSTGMNTWEDAKPLHPDTAQFVFAIKALREANKITTLFHYEMVGDHEVMVEADLLLAIGKRSESRPFFE